MVLQIWSGVELVTILKPSPVRVLFTDLVRVFGDALELTKECVQLGPIDIVFGEFAMLPRENMLPIWLVRILDGRPGLNSPRRNRQICPGSSRSTQA